MNQATTLSERFKIRASAIGKIMTNSRKKDELSKTAQSYCLDWIKQQPEFYNRRKEFSSKYTDKGNQVEDDSLHFAADQLGYGMILKNDLHFSNDFMTGTPDAVTLEEVIDVKSSWDFSTFPTFATEIPNKDYYWQLMGYMALTSKRESKLIYCLMDTPIEIIHREIKSHCYKNGLDPEEELDIYEQFCNRMTYGDVDPKHRIKWFQVEYSQYEVELIEAKVTECRQFIFDTLK